MKHYLFSFFTLGLSAFFFYQSGTLPGGAALLPKLIAGLVALFSAMMIAQAYRSGGAEKSGGRDETSPMINVKRAACFTAMIAVYIYLIPIVGFFVMTPVYITLSYMYLKAANFAAALLISAGFSAFIYALFVWFLKLPVPLGIMEYFTRL
jgi:uncharacterized membrane protein